MDIPNHLNSTDSLVLGLPGSGGNGKLKTGSSAVVSPGNVYAARTKSPLSGISNNGRNSASPYSAGADLKAEEMILTNNGPNQVFHTNDDSSNVPSANLSSTTVSSNTRPSTGQSGCSKRDGIRLTIRKNQPENRIADGKAIASRRQLSEIHSEKVPGIAQHDQLATEMKSSTLTRSLSVNKRTGSTNANCTLRRYGSVDDRDAGPTGRPIIASAKFDKPTIHHSPRMKGDFLTNDTASGRSTSDRDSPFNSYPSPSSGENALTTNAVRGKLKSSTVGRDGGLGIPAVPHSSHLLSRTSSTNSVSDLSPCSEVTDENPTHGEALQTNTSTSEVVPKNDQLYPSECSNSGAVITSQLNIQNRISTSFEDDKAIVDVLENISAEQPVQSQHLITSKHSSEDKLETDKIGVNLDDMSNFSFANDTSGHDDIGTTDLLSIEDIQQTLNSVSAESNLSDIPVSTNVDILASSAFGDIPLHSAIISQNPKSSLDFENANKVASGDMRKLQSPSLSSISMVASTSPATTVISTTGSFETDVNNFIANTLSTKALSSDSSPFTSDSFRSNNVNSTMTCTASFTSTCTSVSAEPKSHLQDILGETDTNRLKNMARPVDSVQYQTTTSTSFNSNMMKTNMGNGYTTQSSSASERSTNQMMSVTSPTSPMNSLSPHMRFGPPANLFPRHPLQQRMRNPPQTSHGSVPHGFENVYQGVGPRERSSSFGDHPGMLPRLGMPYDQPGMPQSHLQMQGNTNSYNVPPSSQALCRNQMPWQSQSLTENSLISPHQSADDMKSSRSQLPGGRYVQQRPVNPMSGLQNTVDSIPNINLMTKHNNMGPPHGGQSVSISSGFGDFNPPHSPMVARPMLPPPSPSIDKRSMSVDGTQSGVSTSRKGSKRERGPSLDSKDGDKKESGPKLKRRKSKSKDDSKKFDSKLTSKVSNAGDTQQNHNLYIYIFNSEMANKAASMVLEQKVSSIIAHHHSFQGNCRLLPSKPGSLPTSQAVTNRFGISSPGAPTMSSVSVNNNNETRSQSRCQLPNLASVIPGKNRQVKQEEVINSPNGTSLKAEEVKPLESQDRKMEKLESDSTQEVPAFQNMSPSTQQVKQEGQEEGLSDEKRKHREESLTKLSNMRKVLLPEHDQVGTPSSPNTNAPGWQSAQPIRNDHYHLSRHLENFKKTLSKDSQMSSSKSIPLPLLKEFNKEKKKKKLIQSHCAENMTRDSKPPEQPPPPYNPAGPNPSHPRWIGPQVREQLQLGGPGINSRHPHAGMRTIMRMPHEGGQFPNNYNPRFPRGVPVAQGPPSNRMGLYPAHTVQTSGVMPRGPGPRIPQPHNMGQATESYPFSEKLKEQASIYRSDGIHNPQSGHLGYDINMPGDANMGPRMNSPDWAQYGTHGNIAIGGRLSRISENISPSHGSVIMPNPGSMSGQQMEAALASGGDSMDQGLQMSNPGLGPMYNIPPYSKGSNSLPNYPEASLSGMMPHPGNNMVGVVHDIPSHSGMMVDTMARRGESRPPDLNINPSIPRSPLSFPGARHPTQSPNIIPTPTGMGPHHQYMSGDMGPSGLPQVSPLHQSIPRSPTMMNSPVANQMQYMSAGQMSGMPSMQVDQHNMSQSGPHSAGPRGAPSDWGALPSSSMGFSRISSSGEMMQSQPGQQRPAIALMMEGVNRFRLPTPLYQNEMKDAASPPPLSHINGNPMMNQEPPPLSHNPNPTDTAPMQMVPGTSNMMIRNPGGNVMTQPHPVVGGPPGYDPSMPGPRPMGPRTMGGMMGDNYAGEFNRPLSHSEMCVSPSMQSTPQSMMQPGLMDIQGPIPSGYVLSQSNVMPGGPHPNNPAGVGMSGHPNDAQPNARSALEFDLRGIIPSEKPSQTLSYYPSGGTASQDASQMESAPSSHMPMGSPPMQQQTMHRFSTMNMVQRPIAPGNSHYMANGPHMRLPSSNNFVVSHPPSYPGQGGEGYMSPRAWDPASCRPQLLPSSVPNMHPGFQSGRPLI